MILCGIYTITNLINGKIYVGYTEHIIKRFRHHRWALRENKHCNKYFQRAWNKYGEENFVFEILEECEEQFLCALEHYWATILDAHNPMYGYNEKPTHPDDKGGNSLRMNKGVRRGFKHTEETREKMRAAHIGRQYVKTGTPSWNSGKKMDNKFRQSLSEKITKIRGKSSYLLDKDYNILRRFSNLNEVCYYFGKPKNWAFPRSVVTSNTQSMYGFYLIYEEEFNNGKRIKIRDYGRSKKEITNK